MDVEKDFVSIKDLKKLHFIGKDLHIYNNMKDEPTIYSYLLNCIEHGGVKNIFYYQGFVKVILINQNNPRNFEDYVYLENMPVKGYFFDTEINELFYEKYIEKNKGTIKRMFEPFSLQMALYDYYDELGGIHFSEKQPKLSDCKVNYFLEINLNEIADNDILFNKIDLSEYVYEFLYLRQNNKADLISKNSHFENEILNQTTQLETLTQQLEQTKAINQQQADTIQQLKERLEAGKPAEPIGDKNPLNDPRTQNNLIRLLLAVNEMAKEKQGNSLDYGRKYNQSNLDIINQKLDLLSFSPLGETAYSTLTTLIREKEQSGKLK